MGEQGGAGETAVKSALSPQDAARLQSARIVNGAVSVVFDVAGLDKPGRERLERDARQAIGALAGVSEVRVALTADKASEKDAPAAARQGPVIIAVGSGKGGVGKSTLSVNLAVALARLGRKVGLVDADIHGPSQPRLTQTEGRKPEALDKKLVPVASPWGVKLLSMGHLVAPGQAVAWRGPMAGNALGQLIDANWGDADVLIVDLPPGTGDIQLSMLQRFKPAGAVIVSTPQDLALIDATRAMHLFEQAHVPIVGIVENMSGYVCPHCGESSDPFGRGGAEHAAHAGDHAFLGRIPLDLSIRLDSDAGKPPAAGDDARADAYAGIARSVAAWLDKRA